MLSQHKNLMASFIKHKSVTLHSDKNPQHQLKKKKKRESMPRQTCLSRSLFFTNSAYIPVFLSHVLPVILRKWKKLMYVQKAEKSWVFHPFGRAEGTVNHMKEGLSLICLTSLWLSRNKMDFFSIQIYITASSMEKVFLHMQTKHSCYKLKMIYLAASLRSMFFF